MYVKPGGLSSAKWLLFLTSGWIVPVPKKKSIYIYTMNIDIYWKIHLLQTAHTYNNMFVCNVAKQIPMCSYHIDMQNDTFCRNITDLWQWRSCWAVEKIIVQRQRGVPASFEDCCPYRLKSQTKSYTHSILITSRVDGTKILTFSLADSIDIYIYIYICICMYIYIPVPGPGPRALICTGAH